MTSRHLDGHPLETLSSFWWRGPMYADTVQARCDVYPKGEDRATSSGLHVFTAGNRGHQLKNV